jgi:tRNA(Leu) C34 or U34 (ribose-2'-O)-methylase TrmL
VAIPMVPSARSLNVAIAAAIVLGEAWRQIGHGHDAARAGRHGLDNR